MNNLKKFSFFSFSLIFFLVLPLPSVTSLANGAEKDIKIGFFFNKNLKIGDKNEDVRILQKILNKNSATRVSPSDDGSPGNETSFFGALTKNAVIKFQELYASDILRPFGLESGTGFVGEATRLKLNSILEADNDKITQLGGEAAKLNKQSSQSSLKSGKIISSETKSSSSETSNAGISSKSSSSAPISSGVKVYNTSEYQVLSGTVVEIQGIGFATNSNIVHLGESSSIENIATDDTSKLSFTVPKDLPLGKYSVWVTNKNGTSKNDAIKIYLVVTDKPADRPVIEKVEPSVADYEGEITVSGKGFTANGNGIYSIFGSIKDIASSDGKTLKFKPSAMPKILQLNKAATKVKDGRFTIWFYVVNENGYNKEAASFVIKL